MSTICSLCPFVALVVSHFGFREEPRFCLRQFLDIAYLLLFHQNHVQTAREFLDLNMDFVVKRWLPDCSIVASNNFTHIYLWKISLMIYCYL